MPEILTESFCERCGTRYTFESAAPRGARLKGIKVMSRGLRNFVMSDDTSLDEAMAAARNETDREATSQQLDAFHKTFNFCMNCRQYTCGNCWNEAEGRCLSCAPGSGQEIAPATFPGLAPSSIGLIGDEAPADGNGHLTPAIDEPLAWPTSDLMQVDDELLPEPEAFDDLEPIDAAERLAALGASPLRHEEPAEPLIAPADAPLMASRDGVQAAPDREPVAETPGIDDRAAALTARTSDLFQRFRPGQSLDDEIAAFERAQAAAAEGRPEPEPVAATPEPEPVPEPVAAAPEPAAPAPEPEPVIAAPEPEPEPAPRAAATAPPRADVVLQPTWQIVAPDVTAPDRAGVPPNGTPGTVQPDVTVASAEPQWPAQPEWPSQRPADGLPFMGRPMSVSGGIDALWAESAREVAQVPSPGGAPARTSGGVQPCVSCGLSLSANARFCRRCGSRQG
jgi:hypothetical protein